ncbi:hypothetical protein LSCM1_01531 [Leishmania martiniquensis]|uniref:Uncharacterized protein n=1 Tax=Leishmania martiniquensis TaxID=1580590 RepID=A0A836KMQ3_9TRYP|nr:hypothetical protein LSCM1_01531 [Leishmania martiniquensis]
MSSSTEAATGVYLWMLLATFGFALPFLIAVGCYDCLAFIRLKDTYERRISAAQKQLRHGLLQCKAEGVFTARQRLLEVGLEDLYESSADDDEQPAPNGSRSEINDGAPDASQTAHGSSSLRPSTCGGELGFSFVLDDVTMLESEGEESSSSW